MYAMQSFYRHGNLHDSRKSRKSNYHHAKGESNETSSSVDQIKVSYQDHVRAKLCGDQYTVKYFAITENDFHAMNDINTS